MVGKHQSARKQMVEHQQARAAEETKVRAARFRKGFRGLWDRVNGQHRKIKKTNDARAEEAEQRDTQERQALIESQLRERRAFQATIKKAVHAAGRNTPFIASGCYKLFGPGSRSRP